VRGDQVSNEMQDTGKEAVKKKGCCRISSARQRGRPLVAEE
jgi:hypothetical protein